MADEAIKSSASNLKDSSLPNKVFLIIHHDQQFSDWDCGLSCVKMVLNEENRQELTQNWKTILEKENIDTSVWSIDLAHLLRRFGVVHQYYTQTLGVNPSFANEAYYRKTVDADRNRVSNKFQDAQRLGIHVEKRQLTIEEILKHLATNNPAVVLINDNCIQCQTHFAHKVQHKFTNIFSHWHRQFVGHYIVICGYDLLRKIIFYNNPIYSQGACTMDFATFEIARKFHGTDEDIILIQKS